MKTHRQEYQHKNIGERMNRSKPVLGGLLLGGLIGAGTALLFAPKSGEQIRADIQNKTIELRDRTADTVKDTVSQVKSKTRQVSSDVVGKARDLTNRGWEDTDDHLENVQTGNSRNRTVHGL